MQDTRDPPLGLTGLSCGSLFSGIGGMDLGLERAGFKLKWQVEIDPYANRVLAKHWPDVRRWDDARTFPPPGDWDVDLIAGGFPCQPHSNAGYKKNRDDPRWIWNEFDRIIRALRPRLVLVENVPGLLVRGFGDVLRDLAAGGYDAEWNCVPAGAFGAPHLRRRVFVLAYPQGERAGSVPFFGAAARESLREEAEAGTWSKQFVQCHRGRIRAFPQCGVSVLDDGPTCELDAVRTIGNASCPRSPSGSDDG
jgi:DNA (cytosine-5)-methyltransferase 1